MTDPAAPPSSTRQIVLRVALGALFIWALLFVPAGSLSYWNGWLFLAALFLPMTVVMILFVRKYPLLLEKRLQLREKERPQKIYVVLSLLWCVVTIALPGFDYRFGWSAVPLWLVVLSVVVMLSGYVLFVSAMIENAFASRIIEIQEGQRLIDTGLYGVVRHPMYMAAIVLYAPFPLVLGSYYGLIPILLLPPLLVYRLLNEEKVLRAGLQGYGDYMERVRYRLIPGIW